MNEHLFDTEVKLVSLNPVMDLISLKCLIMYTVIVLSLK